jgi:hypothetical protein
MSDAQDSEFLTYLKCELPFGYPFEPPLTPQLLPILKERHRMELVYRQAAYFETANQLAATHPWIGYIAALKHEAILSFVPIETTPFVNVADQKVFNTCHQNWRQLRNESRRAIEDGIAFFCERLVMLQRDAAKIDDMEKRLLAALASGFTALLPITDEPPKMPEGLGTDIAGVLGLNKARRKKAEAEIKTWHLQDSYLQMCQQAINKISSVPPETKREGLKDVPGTLAALNGLKEEREILKGNYITPYLT